MAGRPGGCLADRPWWLPYKTEDQDFTAVLSGPTAAHWLGTDELGRDLLSRIFAAAAGTLGTSLITVIVGVGLGTILAMVAAARRPDAKESSAASPRS